MLNGREPIYAALFALLMGALQTPPAWQSLSYRQGVLITDSNGNIQQCSVPGQAGALQPTNWATQVGSTTTDGQVTWTCIRGIKISTRAPRLPEQIAANDSPTLVMQQRGETPVYQDSQVIYNWTLDVDVLIYANAGQNPGTIPAQTANPLLDALEAALVPEQTGGVQSLGNKVFNCYISGKVEAYENTTDGWLVLAVPLKIETLAV